MGHLPLSAMILASIPETFAAITIGLVLFEYNVKDNLQRIALVAIIFSFWSYFSRPILPNMELVALTSIMVAVLLTIKILKLAFKESLFVVIFGMALSMVMQMTSVFTAVYVFGYSVEQVQQGQWLRIFIPWTYISFTFILAALFHRRRISIVRLSAFLVNLKGRNKISQTLIFLMVGQVIVLSSIISNLLLNLNEYKINLGLIILCVLLIIFTVATLFISRRFLRMVEQQVLTETQDAFVGQIDGLLTTIRAQRHDFLNHVQVLHSLIRLKQYEETQSYMQGLLGEVKDISTLINMKNPIIAALLKTKMAIAEQNGIEFKLAVFSQLIDLKIKSYKLVKVLGNLLDNAMEAVAHLPDGERQVSLSIRKDQNTYIFEVKNMGVVIDPHRIVEILKPGITTKKDKEGHGLGLAVVQELVKESKGRLEITSNEKEGTIFKISLPA